MKTGTKVALAVGGATVAGVVLYLILRPSPAAAQPATAPAPSLPNSPQNQTVNMPTPQPPPAPRATYFLEPIGPTSAGMKMGETITIRPPPGNLNIVWDLALKPTSSGGPFSIGPSLQDVSPTPQRGPDERTVEGTYKAIATGTATIHVTPGSLQSFGPGPPSWVGDRGPGFDVTIVVS